LLSDYIKQNKISIDKFKELEKEAILGGDTIIRYIGDDDSTIYGPGVSLFALVDAYARDSKKRLVASVFCNGEYGVENFAMGVPVILGKNGVEKILEFNISDEDKIKYKESYDFSVELDKKS
jgi:malate dehydrogenase